MIAVAIMSCDRAKLYYWWELDTIQLGRKLGQTSKTQLLNLVICLMICLNSKSHMD